MNTFRSFLLSAILLVTGCTHQKDNTVIIHSIHADSIFTEINIFKEDPYHDSIVFKGSETCYFSIDSVAARHFYSCSNDNHFHTQIFITPEDSVSFKTIFKGKGINPSCENSYEVIFEGKNAAHYNYASIKEKSFPWEEAPIYYPEIDLLEYKQELQAYRDQEKEFLSNYQKEYRVSNDFMNYASAEIENLYAFNLYHAVYNSKCRKIPAGYLDSLIIVQNPASMLASNALQLKYIYCSSGTNMEQIYNTISDEVSPEFRSKLLSQFITYFAQKGDRTYKKSLLQVMEQIEKTSTDSTLLATVQEYKPYYLLSGTTLPDNILDETYLHSFENNQKITLRKLFEKYKNKAIYLDFWASWCAPCRSVNSQSADNKSYLTERGIAIVYISIDEDENDWLRVAEDDQITQNQYRLPDPYNSPINDYLTIRKGGKGGIPRYVLFNQKHEIEILDAPRPVDCLFEELKGLIERMQPGWSSQMPTGIKTPRKEEPVLQKEIKKEAKTDTLTKNLLKEKKGILINGVYWANYNVDTPGIFTGNPEDIGMFYKWNNKTAWAVKNLKARWKNKNYYGTTWEKQNDPSPDGWRVPTLDEIKSLYDKNKVSSEWCTINNIKGKKFTDKTNGNSIFLPAVGYRRCGSNGALYNYGSTGHYWSSTQKNKIFSYIIHFDNNEANWNDWEGYIGDGFSIRPVVE